MSADMGDLKQYIRAIGKRLWLVVLIVAVAVSAAYWQAGRAPVTYTASAMLMVTAPVFTPAPVVAEGTDTSFRPGIAVVSQDIIQLASSRAIAARVAKRLNLPGPATVQNAVSGSTVRGTSFIRVSATARRSDLAASLANTTAEEAIAYFREANRANVTEARRFIEDQLAVARTRLQASERAMLAFRESRQMPSVPAAASQLLAALAGGETALDAAQLARRENEVRLAAAQVRLTRERPERVASRATADNPAFRRYQARLIDLEVLRATLSQVYTPQHPRMDQLAREMTEVRGRLTAEARTSVSEEVTAPNPIHETLLGEIATLEVDRAVIGARVAAIQGMQRRRLAAAMSIPSIETAFNRLTRENMVLEGNYSTLSARYQEILLRENQAGHFPAGLQLIEAATAPTRATSSSLPRTAAAAGLIGLFLGIAAALFLETLDDRIRNAHDAERVLGVPVLAEIPVHGAVRTAPATAVFTIGVLLVLAAAVVASAVGRAYVEIPASATDGIRSVATTIASWVAGLHP